MNNIELTDTYIDNVTGTFSNYEFTQGLEDNSESSLGFTNHKKNEIDFKKGTTTGFVAFSIGLAAALSHASTYVHPIIDDKSTETFIDSLYKAETIPPKKQEVTLHNPTLIKDFITRHPETKNLLNTINSQLPEKFKTSSFIEHYKDIEEHWEKIFLIVDTGLDDFNEIEKIEDEIYNIFSKSLSDQTQEKLVITVS